MKSVCAQGFQFITYSFGGGVAAALDRVHHSFCFSPPKRERKLSDEEQQEEAKRPKSPARDDVQQAEQHGSGGEGGDEEEREHVCAIQDGHDGGTA
jgi:hypothetical protein